MKHCPVCDKELENELALNGHLRLVQDQQHIAYRHQHNTAQAPTQRKSSAPFPPPTKTNARQRIEALVKNMEAQTLHDENERAFLQKLEALLRADRDAEESIRNEGYTKGWDECSKQWENALTAYKIEAEKSAELKYERRIYSETEKARNETKNEFHKLIDENLEAHLQRYSFRFECSACEKIHIVRFGEQSYIDLMEFLRSIEAICPECSQRRGLPPEYHSLTLEVKNLKIQHLTDSLAEYRKEEHATS